MGKPSVLFLLRNWNYVVGTALLKLSFYSSLFFPLLTFLT